MSEWALKPGDAVAGSYTVTRLLAALEGAFVYAVTSGQQVTEFFPTGARREVGQVVPPADVDAALWQRAIRDQRGLARRLAGLHHPALSRVREAVEAAGTVYLISDDGGATSLRAATEAAGALPGPQVARLFEGLVSALGGAHEAGLLHLAISPDTISVRPDGTPLLTHFGFAAQVIRGLSLGALETVTPFTPLEQREGGRTGPYSDVYALCASLFFALHGEAPPSAAQRALGTPLPASPPDTPPGLSRALAQGLAVGLSERALSARELLDTSHAAERSAAAVPEVLPGPPTPPPSRPVSEATAGPPAPAAPAPQAPRRAVWPWVLGVLLLAGAGALGLRALTASPGVASTDPAVSAAGTEAAPPVIPADAVSDTSEAAQAASARPPAAQHLSLFVNLDGLNLHSAPEAAAAAIGTLTRGTLLTASPAENGWYAVQMGGQRGWVNATSVLPVLPEAEVQALLEQLAQGGEVSLQRGAYRLPAVLELSADLTLRGQGMNQTVLFGDLPADTVITHAAQIALHDLSIVHVGGAFARTLLADDTTLSLEGVRLSGARRDDSQGEYGSGLWLQSGGSAEIVGSELSGNAFGLYVSDHAQVQAERSQFSHNSASGAFFKDAAGGTLHDVTLDFNGLHGLAVTGTAAPTLSGSRLRHNGQRGATLYGQSSAILTGNRIEANGYQGVGVQEDATPVLSANSILNNRQSGVTYFGRAAGRAEGNTIANNLKSGVSVTQQASPTLSGNTVKGNRENGLSFSDQVDATVTGNRISLNGNPGIAAWGDAQVTASENVVEDNKQSGVVLAERSGGTLSGNTSQNNAFYGLIVTGQAAPEVVGNTVQGNGRGGIFYKQGARGTVGGNTCVGNAGQDVSSALDEGNPGPTVDGLPCM